MKQKFVKSTVATATLLAAGLMGNAMAHTVTGTITAANAVDVYNFQCFTEPLRCYRNQQALILRTMYI